MGKITDEQRNKAIEIALDGGDPKPFLKECGSIAPDKLWHYIKMQLKKKQPEVYEQLAKGRREKTVEVPEKVPAVKFEDVKKAIMEIPQIKVDGPLRVETPEGNKVEVVEIPEKPKKITAPLTYNGYTVCCIESKVFGRFYFDRDHNHLDWTTYEGEEVSFTPAGWKAFMEELPKVAAILGVEL